MDISLDTGLPELPENFYWLVSDYDWWQRANVSTVPRVKVAIIERKQIQVPIEYQFLEYSWFSRKRTRSEMHDHEVRFQVVKQEPGGLQEDKPENTWVHPDAVTPEMILATAKEVYEGWTKAKIAKSLMGIYPPNKLVIGEN